MRQTKEQKKAYDAAYYQANREKRRTQMKARDLEHYLDLLWKNISTHTVNGRYAKTGRKYPQWAVYFTKGIRICDQWQDDPDAFIAWVRDTLGERRKDEDGDWLTLDRIDNEGDYEPGNLRWADALTQANNKGRLADMIELGYEPER